MKLAWRYVAAVAGIWVFAIVFALSTGTARGDVAGVTGKRELGYGQVRFEGKGPEFWHHRAVQRTQKLLATRAELERLERLTSKRFRRDVAYAIELAAATFGVSETELWSVAKCESRLNPFAQNKGSKAAGLVQFLPSTWRDQGITGHSVWDPVANALGAARIVAREGWRQWSCQP